MGKAKDLTNQRFGKVTVLYRDFEYEATSKRRDAAWRCECDCGKQWTVLSFQAQKLKSCGTCVERETINKTFGELTVLEYIGKKRGPGKYNTESWFRCKCSCGNITDVSYTHLSSGHTCTCGCGRESYGERKIREILEKNNIPFISEFSPAGLIGINGGALRFDFALTNNGLICRLVEFDGPQHEKFTNFFQTEEDFLILQEHDFRKNNYALKNNIPLIRIPYNIRNQIALNDILSDKYLIK